MKAAWLIPPTHFQVSQGEYRKSNIENVSVY